VNLMRPDPRSPVYCDRCGAETDARWRDISTYGDGPGARFAFGGALCPTAGCVDGDGSRQVPAPDVPGELTREDRRWLKRQRRLAEEFGRAGRLLAEVAREV
jgi:hypothetical protein